MKGYKNYNYRGRVIHRRNNVYYLLESGVKVINCPSFITLQFAKDFVDREFQKPKRETKTMKLTLSQNQIKPFVSANPMRPAMQGIYAAENTLWATDDHLLLKYPIPTHEGGTDFSAVLPLTAFPKGKGNYTEVKLQPDGKSLDIVEYKAPRRRGAGEKVEQRVAECIDEQYPNVKAVWPSGEAQPVVEIGLSPSFMGKFGGLIGKDDGVKVTFYGELKGVLIEHDTFSAVLMPIKLR